MKHGIFLLGAILIGTSLMAQRKWVDLAATVGEKQQSTALSFGYNRFFGKKNKWEIGLGARWTSAFGVKIDYTTAGPARLTRGTDIPFLVVVSAQKYENWDTITVQRPFVNSFNTTLNIAYRITEKWKAGTNIDLIGFTVGRTTSAIQEKSFPGYAITSTDPSVKPSSFNLLLTGDNDKGTLNSEFYLEYSLSKKWSVRGVYQFLFTEYKSDIFLQTHTDGTITNKYRNKANNFGLSARYYF